MLSRGKVPVVCFDLCLMAALAGPAVLLAVTPAPETAPPVDRLTVAGDAVTVAGRTFTPANFRIEPQLVDPLRGIARWTPTVDGAEADLAALAAAWKPGDHTVGGVAFDAAGQRIALAPVAFTVDVEAPVIRWEVRQPEIFDERGEPSAARRGNARRPRRDRRRNEAPPDLAWSADGRRWLALPWKPGQVAEEPTVGTEPGVLGSFIVACDVPQVFLKTSGPRLGVAGKDLDLTGDRILWITATDAGCGVAKLTARTRAAANGGAVLELETVDLVGNSSKQEIALTP